jgi:glutaredoxin
MYHSTDTYLDRTITIVDEVGNNEVVDITICQYCHDVEEHINNISIQYDLENYETYKEEVKYFWESGALNELEADGMITIDKEEYREDGKLASQSFRLLTEEEFNGRFKIFEQTDFPIQDETWASRRWNKERTKYIDLSGGTDQDLIAVEDRDNWGEYIDVLVVNQEEEDELPF